MLLVTSSNAFGWVFRGSVIPNTRMKTGEKFSRGKIEWWLAFAWGWDDSSSTLGTLCHASGFSWNCVSTCCATCRCMTTIYSKKEHMVYRLETYIWSNTRIERGDNIVEQRHLEVFWEVEDILIKEIPLWWIDDKSKSRIICTPPYLRQRTSSSVVD